MAWELDPATGTVHHSGNVREVYRLESALYQAYAALTHPDDLDEVRVALTSAPPGEMVKLEHRQKLPNGSGHGSKSDASGLPRNKAPAEF